ncbi:MAG: tandem-95 repeat protein [Planctomycetes bacterium]|nr:tandem-95 repeat protein [Planctomycetota bacterium]
MLTLDRSKFAFLMVFFAALGLSGVLSAQPTITAVTDPSAYTEGAAATQIDTAFQFSDPSGPISYDTGNLTVSISANNSSFDRLGVASTAAITVVNAGPLWLVNHTVGPTFIGSFPQTGPGSGVGTDSLVISFGSTADSSQMQDLLRAITYRNTSDNPAASVTVQYSITDASSNNATDSLVINITPVNDNPTVTTNTGLTVDEGDTGTTITTAMLQTTDPDNTAAQITYTLTAVPGFGTLRLGVTPLAVTDTFTQADIDANQLSYDHDGSENFADGFAFNIADTGTPTGTTSGSFSITINPVNDAPAVTTNAGLAVNEGDLGTTITTAMLETTDPDNTPGQLTYTLTTAPGNGTLRLSGSPLVVTSTFTQADINAGNLTYDHDGGETTSDSFEFDVADPAPSGPTAITFNITVTPVNDAPTVTTNAGLTVDEGDTGTTITTAMLETTDPDNTPGQLTYTLTTAPGNGTLRLSGSPLVVTSTFTQADINAGNLTYDHDGGETTSDSFEFDVADPAPSGPTAITFNITVTPVNDAPTVTTNAGLTVDEGDTGTTITTAMLETTDPDNTAAQITYTLTAVPGFGTLRLGVTPLAVTDTFTQADIDANQLSYDHDGSENFADGFAFNIADTGTPTGTTSGSFSITINPVNDDPFLVINSGLPVDEGSTGNVVATGDLEYDDDDNTAAQIIYTVDDISSLNGTLRLLGTPLAVTDTFTQDDIDNNRITYDHDGSETSTGSFDFTVTDTGSPTGSAGSATFTFTVAAVNDAPVAGGTASLLLDEDTTDVVSLNFTDTDIAAGTDTAQVALSATNGTLTLASTTGLSFTTGTGTADYSMVFTGLTADVLAALATVTYDPDGNYNGGDTIIFAVDDQGNFGSGGIQSDSHNVAVTVSPVNDAPVASGTASLTLDEDTTDTVGFSFTDVDIADGTDIAQVAMVAINGTLTLATTSGLVFTTGDGTADASMVFTGLTADVLAAVATVTYAPNGNYHGGDTIIFAVDDVGNFGSGGVQSDSHNVSVTVNPVNDAPAASGTISLTLDEDSSDTVSLSFSDVDIADGTDIAQVTLSASNGVLTLAGITGLSFTTGDGTADASMVFTGLTADVLAALATVTYAPNADYFGGDTIVFDVNDQGNFGSGGTLSDTHNVAVTVDPVNDAPVASGTASLTLDEDTTDTVSLSFSDVDIADGTDIAQVTLVASNGTLTLAGISGLSFTTGDGTADASMVFTGLTADVLAALATVTYAPNADYFGGDTIVFNVNDQGNFGSGGTLSDTHNVAVTVDPVNDAPSFTPGANLDPLPPTAGPQTHLAWATAISKGPANESSQVLTFNLTQLPAQSVGTVNFTASPDIDETTGDLTFTIDPVGSDGIYVYDVTLSDDGGTSPGVDTSSPPALLIIAVWQQNVYVDLAFSALNYGDDPPGPALRYGIDAFDTVQEGVNFVGVTGGVVHVAGGTYAAANVIVPRSMTLDLTAGGVILQGSGAPALQINNGTVVVQGGTLDQQTVQPAVLHVGGTLTLNNGATVEQNANGPAIEVAGSLILDGATVLESSTSSSLCILLQAPGTLNLDGTANANTLTIRTGGNFIDVAAGGPDVTATGNNWFEDATPLDETTRAGGFAIEDHILHAIDNPARGFVRVEATHVFVTQSSGSIQRGVDEANDNDTLEVGVGTFMELVDVYRPLTMRGGQFGNVGAGRLPLVPANETIVVATGAIPASDDLFLVSSDDVSIDGFAFEGDRPLFGTGRDARSGVNNDTNDVSGLLVTNCVFENFAECGVAVANSSGATVGTLSNSLFANCDQSAVRCEDDAFLDITGNRILTFPSAIGIQMANFSDDRGGATSISNNSIDVAANSVAIEIVSLSLSSVSPIVVSNNTIDAIGSGAGTVGITLQGIYNDMNVQLTGNALSSGGGTFDRGMFFWDIATSNLVVSGGQVSDATVGILLDSSGAALGPAGNDSVIELNAVDVGQSGPCTTGVVARAANLGTGAPAQLARFNLIGGNYTGSSSGGAVVTDASGALAVLSINGSQMNGAIAGIAVDVDGPTSSVSIVDSVLVAVGSALRVTDGSASVATSNIISSTLGVQLRTNGSLTYFQNNALSGAGSGLQIESGATAVASLFDNSIVVGGNGLVNQSALAVNAESNWWGSTTGPSHSSNPGGVGVTVVYVGVGVGAVDFSPWWASGVNTLGSAPPGFAGGDTGSSPSGQARHAIPTELRWVQQPGNGTAGIALVQEPIVRATDANGILGYNWDGANGDAFLVFSNNPTGASLQGNPVIQAVDGFADFTNVAVSTGGVGFTVFVIGNHGPLSLANSPVSLPFNIDNLLPVLTAISPDFVHEGAGTTTIQVDGSNYNSTTVVRVNGADRPTFFVNPNRVLAALTPTDTATPTVHTISVFNPSPGGGTAVLALSFTVNDIPSDISLAPASVLENQPTATFVGNLGTTDAGPAPDGHVYSLVFGAGSTDNSSFQVSGATIETAASFDREVKSSYSIRVRSTDSRGAWVEKAFTISILDVNEAPTAVADSYSVNEDGTLNVNAAAGVLANDSDPESNPLSATLIGGAPANTSSFTLNADGSFSLTPSLDYFGPISFQYQVADNAPLAGNTVTVTITVNPVNDQPTVTGGGNPIISEDAGPQSLPAFVGINPGPGNESGQVALAYSVQNLTPAGGLTFTTAPAISPSGTLTFEAAPNSNGSATFQVSVQDNGGTANGGVDSSGLSGVFTITVNAVNDPPSFTVSPSNSIITVAEDSGPHSFAAWAAFNPGPANESGQTVSAYNISNVSNGGLFAAGPAVSTAGTLSFTLNANANGSSTFDVSVTDDGGGSATSPTQTFTIIVTPVNDAPTLSTVATLPGATEDTPFAIPFGTLAAAADEADVDGDPVHFRIDSLLSGSLTMNGNPVIPGTTVFSTGSLLWTPPANQSGTLSAFTVLAWDGLLDSGTPVAVQVSVSAANDAPSVSTNTGITVFEGDIGVIITAAHLETSDVEDGPANLTYTLTAVPVNGTLRLGGTPLGVSNTFTQDDIDNSQLTYDHNGSETTGDSFGFDVADTGPLSVSGSFSITVTPVNDAPTLSTISQLSGAFEDQQFQIDHATLLGASNALDVDSTPIRFRIQTVNSGNLLFNGGSVNPGVTLFGPGDLLQWTAPQDANGVHNAFSVSAWDGALSSGAPVSVSIDVTAVNDAPDFSVTPANSFLTVAEDSGPYNLGGWSNFNPGPANEAAQSVLLNGYTVFNVTNPSLFSAGPAVSDAGALSFTLAPHANGITNFKVRVRDDGGTANGGNDTSQDSDFTIVVTAVNDAPTLTSIANFPGGVEDTQFVISFAALQAAADEADVDGDPLSFRIQSVLSGSLTMNGNPVVPGTAIFSGGQLEWTPAANANGPALSAFSVLAWDGLLNSAGPVNVTVDIAPANDDPFVVTNLGLTLNEGATGGVTTARLEVSDLEQGPALLTFTVDSIPANGTLDLVGFGTLTVTDTFTQQDVNLGNLSYTHDGSETGSDSFTFHVTDGAGGALGSVGSPLAFAITINPLNDLPTLSAGTLAATALEDTPLDILFGDLQAATLAADVDGSVVGFRVISLVSGTLQIDQTGTGLVFVPYTTQVIDGSDILRWQAPLNLNGTAMAAFTVEAIDNGTPGSATSATDELVSIDVTAVNDQPTATGSNVTVGEDSGAFGPTAWAGMLPGGGADESTQTAVNFNLTNVSNPGLFSAGPVLNPATGELSFTPASNAFGVCTIEFTVQDSGGTSPGVDTSAPVSFTITITAVNDAPTLSFISTMFGGPEDTPITVPFAVLQASANEADIDSLPVNFRIEGVTAGSTLTLNSIPVTPGATVFTNSDTLVWTPGAHLFGTLDAFTVTAFDGSLSSGTPVQVRLFIEGVNDQPSFSATNPAASLEDAGAVTVVSWASFNAGPNEQTIQAVLNYTVSGVSTLSGNLAFLSGPTIDNNGNLHYTAVADTNGTAEFYATVRDTGGTASGGIDTSVLTGPFVITVTAVNDAPSFSTTGNPASVNEDSGAASVAGWASVSSFGPVDEAGQSVSAWLVDQVSNPALFAVLPAVNTATGELTYTPAGNEFGTSTFRVRVQDNGGTANGGVDTSAGQTFTITVNPVNDAPSVTGGSSPTVLEDAGPQTLPAFVGINPGPANEAGQAALAYTVQNLTPAGGLTFSSAPAISPTGTLTFQTAPDSNGSATFQVQVQDDGGTAAGGVDLSALSAVFTITVTPVNDAPTMTTFSQLSGALEDTGFTITYAMLQTAGNEADIDSTPVNFRVESVIAGTLTKNAVPVVPGTTTIASGESLVWTPPANLNGVLNAFTLVAWDGSLASSPALTAQVGVTAVNDVPSFTKGSDITVAWDQGAQSIPGWASGISAGPTDEASQLLTFNVISNNNPALFSVQPAVSGAGTLTFTPNTNVAGTANISITLQDNGGTANGGVDTSAPQNFNITITTAGEINLFRLTGNPIADGANDSVGGALGVLTPYSFTYTIENLGNGVLNLNASPDPVLLNGASNCEAYVTHQAVSPIAAAGSTTFVVWLKPLAAGPFSIDVLIPNTDADENPYDITIQGTAVDAPDIKLSRGFRDDIADRSTDDLGSIPAGVTSSITWTIENVGTGLLTFGSPAVSVITETNCMVLANAPGATLAASASDSLVLDIQPTVPGRFSFTIQIDSDDPDEGSFVLHGTGAATSGTGPELELFGRRVLAPADTENVGLIPSGSNTTFLYEVRNVGSANLNVTGTVAITNAVNAVVVLTIAPGATVTPGNMTPFGIDVQPLTPGAFQFDLELVTNDADESPLPVTVVGQAVSNVVPEIAIDRDGAPIADGGTDDIGDLPAGVFTTFVYRVRNEGTGTLNITPPLRVFSESNCQVRVTAMPQSSVAPQDDTAFLIGVMPLSTGALSAILRLDSDDSDEGQYFINIIGTGPQPDIQVEYPLYTPQPNLSVLQVGGAGIGSAKPITLYVRNIGTGPLNIISVTPSVEVNCVGALVSAGSSPVAPDGSTTLDLTVTPAGGGAFSVTFTIVSNDPDTPNFEITIEGSGVAGGGGGGGDDGGCSTSGGNGSWLLLFGLLCALGVAIRTVRKPE